MLKSVLPIWWKTKANVFIPPLPFLCPFFFPSSPLQQVDDRLTEGHFPAVSFVSYPELTGKKITGVAIAVSK